MIEKLRAYVEELFSEAPQTKQAVEIKEEILQNTVDRYNDLIAEGKTPEAAYNISVAGIGDVGHLLDSLKAPVAVSGYTRAEIEKNRRTRSVLLSVAVMLYILSVIPVILFGESAQYEVQGVVLMFIMVAIATGLIIYRSGIKLNYSKDADTVVEDFREWNRDTKERKSLNSAIGGAMTAVTLVIYFLVSFSTGAWYITWLIFIIGAAVENIIKAIIDLTR